ncbi:MAG TPA: Fe-S-cluster-containing hydrogenase [Clostridia bacterium]|nr:Fe-S-cluster-containing hydrogenase [Clostridia bacterium]
MTEPEKNRYWRSPQERDADVAGVESEFPEELPRGAMMLKRRDFLRVAGFTAAAVATGCSRAPVQKAIPMLMPPEEIVPGTSLQYATTCGGCSAGCGVLAKVRDGRPIKLEGNPGHALSRGGLCAIGQASLLGLYDSQRLTAPLSSGKSSTWEAIDREITKALNDVRTNQGRVRFVTGSITSPTERASIGKFLQSFPDAKHVVYDPLSHSAILDAHEQTHGSRVLPHYRFDRAEVIVAVDADFLGTWISPVEFTAAYRAGRSLEGPKPRVSWHVQFESRMTVTGSKADERYAVSPHERTAILQQLADRIAAAAGKAVAAPQVAQTSVPAAFVETVAQRLWKARGRSLVVSGSQDIREQVLVNFINHLLGNSGSTVEIDKPSYQASGNDRELIALLEEIEQGKVKVLLIAGVNPVFDLPAAAAIKRVPLVVSFAQRVDETASLAHYILPEPHSLESWRDAEPVAGNVAVMQPTVQRLGQTRTLIETLSAWSDAPATDYQIVREYWRTNIFPRQSQFAEFDAFWERTVHDGGANVQPLSSPARSFNLATVKPAAPAPAPPAGAYALVLYPKVAMLAGSEAYNPWLHELPDPITKITWDNYACLSPATASKLGISEGDVVRISREGALLELPAYVQPGQHDAVVAVALGYGSVLSRRFAEIGPRWIDALPSVGADGFVGKNAAGFLHFAGGAAQMESVVAVSRTGGRQPLASTQTHHTLRAPEGLAKLSPESRPIIQETTLAAFLEDGKSGVHEHEASEDLWPADHPYKGPRWAMVVDLQACTGCSACVIACQAENNIPVVGKDEVRRNREMHWVRIDRYYAERPDGRIDVAHQPMMCQQCENAPCETVCPVLATVHSEDGLSQQVYNRCVGTRYCANNCPYKGRRFNWFNYAHDDRLQNLVLNPDVTVRSRGVMEKCSFCVQRIQGAKIDSKRRGTSIADGEVQTACQQSCPARAIYFGDLNDPKSEVSRKMRDPRRYRVLSELNVRPAVGYLTVVRNRDEKPGGGHNG